MKKICLSLFLLLIVHCCYADYTGAVVEYNPQTSDTPVTTYEENIKNYIYQMELARNFGVQIIVFPEYGLTGIVENPEGYGIVVPNVGTSNFSGSNELLQRLSNAAFEHRMYVVVNLLEQANNTNNKTFYYNTNLVFANDGSLVAKYRKINLFQEPRLTPGTEPATFKTNFGTFGLMTCMDVLHHRPSQIMLENSGVTDVILTSAWTSYLPFYMSLEVQVGYAMANKVNLLASNINDPANGRGGSGIYGSDGTILRRILTDSPATNIVYTNIRPPGSPPSSSVFSLSGFDVLRNDTQMELANYKNLTDFQYKKYVYKPLDLSRARGNITEEICHGAFCCHFNIVTLSNEVNSSEVYKLVAYSGKAKWGGKEQHINHCNLVACQNSDTSSCGLRPSSPYTTSFRQIRVWGNYMNLPGEFFRPTSLKGDLQPVYNATYEEIRRNASVTIKFSVTQPTTNVVVFGLFVKGGAETSCLSLLVVAIAVAVKTIF